jgi:hypothetical protein
LFVRTDERIYGKEFFMTGNDGLSGLSAAQVEACIRQGGRGDPVNGELLEVPDYHFSLSHRCSIQYCCPHDVHPKLPVLFGDHAKVKVA